MSTNKIISQIEAEQMQKELPEFGPGDTVVVQVKVKEGNRERLQAFEAVSYTHLTLPTRSCQCSSRWWPEH